MFIRFIKLCFVLIAFIHQSSASANNAALYCNVNDTDTSRQKLVPVHDSDLQWAIALEEKVKKSAYNTDSAEMKRYEDIAKRIQKRPYSSSRIWSDWSKPYSTIRLPRQLPDQQEIDWALQLENKVKGGYQPNAKEIASYENIASRLQGGEDFPDIQIQINWALEWLQKTKNGNDGSAAEMAMFRWCQQLPEFQTQLEAEAQRQGVKIAIPEPR